MKTAPVVTSITSSGGVNVTKGDNGSYTLSTGDSIEVVRDAELVNLNNVVELTDDPYFYYDFPANRDASMIGKVTLPILNNVNEYEVSAWVYRRGIEGAVTGSTLTFPEIDVELTHVASPRHKSNVVMPTGPEITTTISTEENTVQSKLYYGETPEADRLTVSSEGTVYAKLSIDSGANDKYKTRFGILVHLKSGTGTDVVPCGT
jgi:hypothetical protein